MSTCESLISISFDLDQRALSTVWDTQKQLTKLKFILNMEGVGGQTPHVQARSCPLQKSIVVYAQMIGLTH